MGILSHAGGMRNFLAKATKSPRMNAAMCGRGAVASSVFEETIHPGRGPVDPLTRGRRRTVRSPGVRHLEGADSVECGPRKNN